MSLLQDADFKTEAQLVTAGATKAQLLNDTKIYITGAAQTLDDAIVAGDVASVNPPMNLTVPISSVNVQGVSAFAARADHTHRESRPFVLGTRATPFQLDAGVPITVELFKDNFNIIESNGGPITMTASPNIEAGDFPGQKLDLLGTSDTNTVELLGGLGTFLNGPIVLANNVILSLVWDGVTWVETGRNQ